ncbi:DUF5979 domain-containing protein [Krasilnikoviella flava]|uniref:Uncharacterized conserved protein n=1 Tax=Krasilnikoviella flava TaxID=526729 RepID=A0A1T5K742_9MICO|nr:DUF5979 domain-containing protein [Krasilnikoviella flava]SKC59542.1 Uncharacterized conserved protein [Krasilnikoviella flava]
MVNGRRTSGARQRHKALQQRARRRVRRGASVLGVFALALAGAVIPATTASAAEWGIQKQVTSGPGPYEPGQNVTYSIQISCSDPNLDPCVNAVMTDELPDELILVSATVSSGGGEVTTDGNTVTYTNPSVPNGQQALVTVTAQVDPDLPYSQNGVPIPNTATVDADNAEPVSDDVEITPVVELELDSDTAKTIEPEGALAEPGTPATMTLEGTNTSNAAVDTLVVQDPVDPTADPNPFTYLEYSGTGDITLPPNADTVEEEYWDGDSWEPLDDTVDPTTVQGVRYTFSGDIQPGATATIPVDVQQSEAVTELNDPTTVTNDTSSYVTLDDAESEPTTDSDTYVITPPNTSVTASKTFSPAEVSAGDPTTVTLGATNTGTPVDTMTIIEPAPGTDSPFEGEDPITFTGWGTDGAGAGVVWPTGATEATVTFTCADGSTPSDSTTTANTLPDPPVGCEVVGFTIEYTGNIVNGGAATVPFTADTDPDQTPDNVSHPNEIEADVPSAEPATADAELVTLVDRLATDIEKIVTPSTIPAVPGQSVVVQLPSQLLPFGPDGSTTEANTFVVQEPVDPANPGEFWENFAATGVRSTDVPANATLTVNYWDGDSWEPAPGCGPTDGPATVNCDLPAGAEGVQFVFTSDDGFPPGTEFQPNFTADYTGPTDRDDPIENCGYSAASADTVDPTEPVEGCDTVDPFPVDGEGPGDFIDKTMLGDPATVRARTDDQVTAQITWSTGGFSGVDPMVISDIENPETTAIADSFYDAFNLVSVDPIDASVDPMIPYDQVESVELFVDGAWVEASGDPCPEACDGTFPGYTLTAEEQESATSVRLTYTESPSRSANPTDPTAPAAGDGVARSTQDDGRHLDLTFQVRDFKRSAPTEAVLGATSGTMYNTDTAGVVNDTAEGTATYDGEEFTDADADTAEILDVPLNVTVDKEWTGGPLSVPPPGTPNEFYPSTTVTVTGTNNSAAKIEELRLADPGAVDSDDVQTAPGTPPFDAFTLTAIELSPPAGTETTTVTLTNEAGETATFTEAEAEALGPDVLAQVVGVEVAYDGLVEPGAAGTMDLTLQLRETDRYTDAPITVADYSPVPNGAVATLDDPGGTGGDVRQAFDDANMVLQDAAIALEVGKSFDPDTIVEPNNGVGPDGDTPVVMTLTGQPLGPSRSVEMVLTDDDPQFWNQYDFVGFDPSAGLVNPIDQVQVDVFTGGTFVGEPDSPDPVTVTGGAWVEGTPSSSFTLPDGVEPADVQGLRFTFTRADGAIWENPATPTQSVPIQILRRDEMRSGGEVQHDLAGNPVAPGESAPGVASNSVQGSTTGADLVVDPESGDLVPVSGTDEAESSILYQHATNGVTIEKDFAGTPSGSTQAPDATFPMNITFTNTGDRPIIDPVVTDAMPVDDEGPQLTLAEDADEPFSYALGGVDDPDTSTPDLPTDAAQVTVDQTGDIESLGFSFPEGSVLEVGQSYTITVQVNFRFAIEPQTLVENTAGVTGDRPWDECSPRLNEETGACEADADVTPTGTAVLQQQKFVKATDDDELDVMIDPDYTGPITECETNAAGFYAYPCTPVIAPGHDETWRVRVDNVGNLPMNKVVLYDRFPTPGDTGSLPTSTTQRGSQWTPIFTDDPLPRVVNAPAGSEVEYFYTTVDDYCGDDIQDPQNEPICSTDPDAGGWAPLTPDLSDEVLESITAIKNVITFPEDDLFQPGQFIALEATSTTPPVAPEAGDRSIAWNSAAASGVVVSNQGEFNLLPTEGVKVGVATATGPLEVNKVVTGEGAEYAPDSFDLTVECTSAVGSWVETELDPIPITVTPGTPVTVPNLPYGAECTVTEDPAAGQTELIVGSVTIGESPDVTELTAVNVYDLASIDISKEVVTDAVDQDGEPVPFGPFEATVECTFLGEDVYAEGYGPDDPMVVALEDGETVTLDGLPVGSECTVTETGTGNASSVSITVAQAGQDPVVTDGPSADLTLEPDVLGESTNDVTLSNVYDVGSIELTKVVDGDGADEFGDGPFTFDVVCTYDDDGDGPLEPRTVYDDSVSLGGDDPLVLTIDDLPAGAVCDITETDDGGATDTVVTPNPVTVGADETAEVTATNTFDLGSVAVDKVVTGEGAELYGAGPFTVEIACTYEGDEVAIDPASQTFVGGETVTFAGIPIGAECDITETDDGGATSSDVSPSTVTVGGEDGSTDPVEVTATNTFDVGEIAVDKAVDGDGAAYAQGPYEVTLACTFNGQEVEIPEPGATQTLNAGDTVTYEDLPIGAECTVTESDQNQATSVTIEPENVVVGGEDGTETSIAVDVTNTYDLGQFTVTKDVVGDGADFGVGPFTVEAACTFEGAEIDMGSGTIGGATRTVEPGGTVTYSGLPVGAECTVTETADYGAADVTIDPETVIVPAADGDPVAVTVTNRFDVGTIEVDKELAGLGALYGPGPFEVTLECTYQGDPIEIPGGGVRTFTPGEPAVYDGLPVGAECSVIETNDFGASSTTMSVDGGDAVDGTTVDGVVVPPNDGGDPTSVTVTAENTFLTAPLVVRKTVDGDGAAFAPAMPDLPGLPELPDPLPTDPEEIAALLDQVNDYVDQVGAAYQELPYSVTLECTDNQGAPVGTIPGGPERRFGPGVPALYFGLQHDDECTITETEVGGATSTTIDPNPVTIDGEATITAPNEAAVTNTYDVGEFTVEKAVDGDGASFAAGPYEVSAACTFEGTPIDMDSGDIGGATRTVTPDEPAAYDGLPIGAECVVTETDAAGATSSTVSTAVEDGEPGQVVVPGADADPAVVTVTNTFDVGSLAVDKVVDFEGDAYDVGPFEVTLACTFQGEDIEIPGGAAREIAAGDTVTYAGLPIGAECVVTETDDGGAASSTVSSVGDGDPGAVTVAAEAASVTVTNTFDAVPPPIDPGDDGDTGGGGWLPTTGADIALWVGLAVLLVAGGIILVGVRRRHQH